MNPIIFQLWNDFCFNVKVTIHCHIFPWGTFMKINKLLSGICLIATMLVSPVHAAVIDFEDVAVSDTSCDDPTSPIISRGFIFTTNFAHCVTNSSQAPGLPSSGSNFLVEGGDPVFISALDGSLFSVLSLDLSTSQDNVDLPNYLTVTGEFQDGTEISTRLTLSDFFQTFSLTGFNDLAVLRISALELGSGYFALDNLVTAGGPVDVPLPATLPLMGLALAALAAARRRRH